MDRRRREKQLTPPGLFPDDDRPAALPRPDAADQLSKQEAADLAKLHLKKYRDAAGRFVIEGERLVRDAIEAGAAIETVIIAREKEDRFADLRARLAVARHEGPRHKDARIRVLTTSAALLARITETRQPQGIAAVARMPEINIRKAVGAVPGDLPVTVLWDVADPGNLGTIIRSADWFGSRGLLYSRGSVDPFNAKAVRGTMGSLFRVRLGELPDADALFDLARECGRDIIAAVAAAEDRPEHSPPPRQDRAPLLVFGGEAHGLPATLLARIPRRISIPGGGAESLNLAVAHGILLSQFAGMAHRAGRLLR